MLINEINKSNKKESIILIGRGASIDKINLKQLNNQDKFDICTINDAIKVIKNPKFCFIYDIPGLVRNYKYLNKAQHLLTPTYKYRKLKAKYQNYNIEKFNNLYLFDIDMENDYHSLKNWAFTNSRCKDNKIYNRATSVSGVINFLFGYMQYKTIYYIGFDNTKEYSNLVFHDRCFGEENNIEVKYKRGWKGVLEMLKYYPHQDLKPLRFYLKKNT